MFRIKTELLNLFTGLLLVLCGALNLFHKDFVTGMGWIIFGSMYLVMDDYLQNENKNSLFEKLTDLSRQIFSWVGFIGSLVLTGYYIRIFWL